MNSHKISWKSKIGCWLNERWKAELVLRVPTIASLFGLTWLDICNRNEQLENDERTGGRKCVWKDSSSLTLDRIFPQVGQRLFRTLFSKWKVTFLPHDTKPESSTDNPLVSVIIAFRGSDRMPLLLKTLEALRGQTGVEYEIVVVEQSPHKTTIANWPADVIHLHQKYDDPQGQGSFNKSSALNYGVLRARGIWLAILDGDYIVPEGYLASVKYIDMSLETYWPARFIFHLSSFTTANIVNSNEMIIENLDIEKIIQNNPTPFFMKKESYWKIGGHDEEFSGWGGEDVEFRDRARTLNYSEAGFIPIIHLWHAPALKKANGDRNQKMMNEKLLQNSKLRVHRLREKMDLQIENSEKI